MDWWRKPVVLEKTSTAGCPPACRVVAAGAARSPGAEQAARGTARTRPSSSGTARRERRRTLVGGHLLVARRRLDAPARRCRGDPAPVRRIARSRSRGGRRVQRCPCRGGRRRARAAPGPAPGDGDRRVGGGRRGRRRRRRLRRGGGAARPFPGGGGGAGGRRLGGAAAAVALGEPDGA